MDSFHKGSMNPSCEEELRQGKHDMATPARAALAPAWSAQEEQAQAERVPALREKPAEEKVSFLN